MLNDNSKALEFVLLVKEVFSKQIIKKLVLSRPNSSEISKISGRLCSHRGKNILAFEYSLPGNTVSHKNIRENEIESFLIDLLGEYRQANLITTVGDVEWKASSSKQTLLGVEKLKRKLTANNKDFEKAIESLDNKKSYLLNGNEEFLIRLGISDKSGRIHDKKQGKFRQINRFLEHIEAVYSVLPSGDKILIYDLCCGKSYLSFAVYYYLTAIKSRSVELLGIDLKRDVINWCENEAMALGFHGMKFIYDDVRNTPTDRVPDMVISLHACDIATDIVINTAVRLGAKIILSTPCCHRYLNDKINSSSLGFVTKYPHLKNKLCEAITDAIRAERLASYGYDVTVPELTDPENTPKNTLIRAIRCEGFDKSKREKALENYDKILEFVLGNDKTDYLKGFDV